MKRFLKYLIFCLTLISVSPLLLTLVRAADSVGQSLQDAINQRAKQLQEIAAQIQEHQKNLEQVQGQSKSLKNEISKLNTGINQVSLSIKQSEISLDKLNLEIESLGYTISDAEKKISNKEEAIIALIREMQQREGESPLIIFLKNKNLAESVFEAQSLADLNSGLSIEINELKDTKIELADQMQNKTDKKRQVEAENVNLKNRKIILAETKQDKQALLTETKNKEQLYQKSISDLQKLQDEIAAEIEKMDRELRQKIDITKLPGKHPGVLAMPVSGILSQDYGATRFAKYGYRGKWHNGVDIAAPIGTPVFAAEKGRVLAVANQDYYCYRGAYGKYIAIQHDNNLTTLYAHLSLQIVHPGDIVERGSLIGYSGKTGYATGPHLHFGVYAGLTFYVGPSKACGPQMPYGGDLDPMDYLSVQ